MKTECRSEVRNQDNNCKGKNNIYDMRPGSVLLRVNMNSYNYQNRSAGSPQPQVPSGNGKAGATRLMNGLQAAEVKLFADS
jgi:hypothetical protein